MSCKILLLLSFAFSLSAQVDRASLNGTVTDPAHAVVPGAKVVALSTATGLRREAISGNGGNYQFSLLPVGLYTISVSKPGFRAAEFKDVELAVGQTRTLDVKLAVGAVTETVEVTSTLEEMNRSSAEVGGLVEQ